MRDPIKLRRGWINSFYGKGYFYSIDALIAIMIISIGMILVIQGRVTNPPMRTNVYYFAEDLTNYLAQTKIYDLNDDSYSDSIKKWKVNGSIAFIDNTLLEQAGEFYARGQLQIANNFLSNVTQASASLNYNFVIIIDGTPVFSVIRTPEEKAKSIISNKLILSGFLDNRNTWGPYKAEVRTWQ